MKPTPQATINHDAHASFPVTDYAFQSTRKAPAGSVTTVRPHPKARSFHKLSSEFFATETHLDFIGELFFFILISALAAWSIMSMFASLAWMKIVT